MSQTVAVVLAAGSGRRFRGTTHKLAAELRGAPVAMHAIETAASAAIGPVIVVTGAHRVELPDGVEPGSISLVQNPDWESGQLSSVLAGIGAARQLGASAVVIGLADQPFVVAEAWRAVAASSSPIAVATYDGQRGNPVRLHESVWPLLPDHAHPEASDAGARTLIRLHPELVEAVPCPGSPADIDTLEDLQRWQNSS